MFLLCRPPLIVQHGACGGEHGGATCWPITKVGDEEGRIDLLRNIAEDNRWDGREVREVAKVSKTADGQQKRSPGRGVTIAIQDCLFAFCRMFKPENSFA